LRGLKPETTLQQAKAVTRTVNYDAKTKHYDEADFGIDLPVSFQPIPRPPGPYQSYSWLTSNKGSDAAQIDVYEDTIPTNLALNRVQIVEAEGDHLRLDGAVSDNCSKFTKGLTRAPGQSGVPAKWLDVNFLCDQSNQARDVIGTSSTDGINIINLRGPTGAVHKFFFVYTNQDITPDYTTFLNVLQSFRVK
jgi:hypothetical protein